MCAYPPLPRLVARALRSALRRFFAFERRGPAAGGSPATGGTTAVAAAASPTVAAGGCICGCAGARAAGCALRAGRWRTRGGASDRVEDEPSASSVGGDAAAPPAEAAGGCGCVCVWPNMKPRRRASGQRLVLSVERSCSSLTSFNATKRAASSTDHSARRGGAEPTKEAIAALQTATRNSRILCNHGRRERGYLAYGRYEDTHEP